MSPAARTGREGPPPFEILPAIDLRHGRVVRLRQGDDARATVYGDDPLAVAAAFAAAGARRIHVVDLDAAFGEAPQRGLVERLAASLAAPDGPRPGAGVQLGGGLRDRAAVEWALGAGCERAVLASMPARDPAAFAALAQAFPGRLVPAVEVAAGEARVAGWTGGAAAGLDELCGRLRGLPCPAVLVTDIERDGMLSGPNLELARRVARAAGLPALLSGGMRTLADLAAAAAHPEIAGAILGRALYEGQIELAAALELGARPRRTLGAGLPRAGRSTADAPGRRGMRRGPGGDDTADGAHAVGVTRDGHASARRDASPVLPSGLTRRVIPCLDVAGGRVVKGVRFRDLTDQGDPAAAAGRYAAQGADEIVFLDITAAPDGRDTDLDWVRRTAERVFIPLTVGGGVRSAADAGRLLGAGADKVAVNSAAVRRPGLLAELAHRYGSQCVVLSVDARRTAGNNGTAGGAPRSERSERSQGWEVVIEGGRTATGRDALDWIAEGVESGAGEVLLTSIDHDGTQGGYDLELIAAAVARLAASPVPLIASGGAGEPAHLAAALEAGAAAVLAASIFHQGTHTVAEVKRSLAAAGFPMREEAA